MSYQPGNFYHIYNRGNNKQRIFFNRGNYFFFIEKIRKEICPYCNVLAYCLMPNHYHLLIYFGIEHHNFRETIKMQNLDRKIGTVQSSYTRAINNEQTRTGSLFQAKFKANEIYSNEDAFLCFNYIHHNPRKAGLVESLGSWEFSSFNEYAYSKKGICAKVVSYERLRVSSSRERFIEQSEKGSINPDLSPLSGFEV